MRKTIKVQREVEVTVDCICNKCGDPETKCLEELSADAALKRHIENPQIYGLIEASVSGGYQSYALDDGTSYTFSLCEGCLRGIFDTFKIPVQTTEVL